MKSSEVPKYNIKYLIIIILHEPSLFHKFEAFQIFQLLGTFFFYIL